MASIILFPRTRLGRGLLRAVLPAARDGRLGNGMTIAGQDWDRLALEEACDREEQGSEHVYEP